ncbi:hypothetical protein [Streptomyces alanosinicus]|uniref:Uncharacterized protein n=1 Tax=Streptomyces alanosinicus TaxID=68171 RepID=A0A919D5X8_9ACTN|nr:hypothetical protein [Streptomyces alanosinicus]GHE12942.1 hypothetical protein GCM10010339_78260 [Streptomyces alanosinicus]
MSLSEATVMGAYRAAVVELVAPERATALPLGIADPQGNPMLLLAAHAQLDANPTEKEPLEDAFEGVMQSLSCARAF